MRSPFSLFTCLLATLLSFCLQSIPARAEPPQWQTAAPGLRYEFPRDHGAHPAFKTEWWYFTGSGVSTQDAGQEFGFELTFVRQRHNHIISAISAPATHASAWISRS